MRKRNVMILGIVSIVVTCCMGAALASILLGSPTESVETTATVRIVAEATPTAPPATQTPQVLPSPTRTLGSVATATVVATKAIATSKPVATPCPTQTPTALPSSTPTPNVAIVLSPEEMVNAVLAGEGSTLVRMQQVEGEEAIFVAFHVSDNLTSGMIRDGAFQDIGHMAELIWATGLHDYAYCFGGLFPLIDKYGVETSDTVIIVCLLPETLARINWGSHWWQNIPDLAFVFELHPDLW